MKFFFTVALLVAAHTLAAQSVPGTDQILVPITPQKTAGAFGSQWETTLAVTNLSDTPITLLGYQPALGCQFECPPPPPVPPHATIYVSNVVSCAEVRGVFLFVEHGREADLAMTLRSRDLSRQSQSWGTTIPTIPISDGFTQRFGLTDIPVDPLFRSTLRLYALAASGTQPAATVRVYAVDPKRDFPTSNASDALLFQATVPFIVPSSGGGTTGCPAFAELALSGTAQLAGQSRVRVEIEPLTATKYWAVASVTNNDTQEVTIIAPH